MGMVVTAGDDAEQLAGRGTIVGDRHGGVDSPGATVRRDPVPLYERQEFLRVQGAQEEEK